MNCEQIRCFGVGDGMACADRCHSSYLYELAGATLLLDCGEPVSRCFKLTGLPPDCIDAILLSHLHADHYAGFFMLMQGFWLDQRRRPLPVHAPAEGIEALRLMLRTGYLFDELIGFPLTFAPLAAGRTLELGAARVTAFRTKHLESLRQAFQAKYPVEFAAHSFLIEHGGRRLGHSADLGAPQDLEPMLRTPLDLLVCELAHFEAGALFAYLQHRPVRRLALIHLGRQYWGRQDEVLALAAKMLPGLPVEIPRDGSVLKIPAALP
jgi:ribonuclease BN (tRNA processing enzyme)